MKFEKSNSSSSISEYSSVNDDENIFKVEVFIFFYVHSPLKVIIFMLFLLQH